MREMSVCLAVRWTNYTDAGQGCIAGGADGVPLQHLTLSFGLAFCMSYESKENAIRLMLVDVFHFHTEGLDILVFNDGLEAPAEAVLRRCPHIREDDYK